MIEIFCTGMLKLLAIYLLASFKIIFCSKLLNLRNSKTKAISLLFKSVFNILQHFYSLRYLLCCSFKKFLKASISISFKLLPKSINALLYFGFSFMRFKNLFTVVLERSNASTICAGWM